MMEFKQNLHTHTTYCDGIDSPREMIEKAQKLGFSSIGFSGHSYISNGERYAMSIEGTEEYFKEITRLKKEYAGKMEIYCGIEFDMYSEVDLSRYDYIIGSVHNMVLSGECVDFDRTAPYVKGIIDEYFGGDGMKYAKKYYETLAELPKYGKFDIIGHFDIITKHAESVEFFDINSKEYLEYAIEAAESLAGKIPFFEVNTGAISRGYRTTPYPMPNILKELKRLGFGAVITSDCHNADFLECGYEQARELLKSCGFSEKYVLKGGKFIPVEL